MVAYTDIVWGASHRWPCLLIVAIIIAFLAHFYRDSRKNLALLGVDTQPERLLKHFSWGAQKAKLVCYVSAFIFLAIALLEPQWGKVDKPLVQEGRDIIIALDISRSMLASDFKPSRLEHAKQKIRRLLSCLPAERVGLLLFSAEAFVQCPLTADYRAFEMFLANVTTESFGSGTTALDRALTKATSSFIATNSDTTNLIVVISDGEDFSTDLTGVIDEMKRKNVVVSALGVASEQGAPIPKFDYQGRSQGYEMDEQGKPYVSRLNRSLLERITRDVRGRYVTSVYDDSDVRAIAQFVETFEKTRHESKEYSTHQAQYPWFIGICALLLAIAWIL